MPITVKGSGGGGVTLSSGAAATDTTLTLPNTTGTVALIAGPTFTGTVTATTITSPSATALTIQSAGTTAMTVDTSQNVGIGTTSPAAQLEVSRAGSSEIRATTTTSAGNVAVVKVKGPVSNYGIFTADNANYLAFYDYTANAERMRLDSSGNFLVGTTTATLNNTGFRIVSGASQSDRAELGSIATTSANIGWSMYSTGAAAYRFYVNWAGTVFATNTTISGISDQRLKENIRDLDVGLDAIMALKPRKFDWKDGKGKNIKNDRGFIAQEIEEVFPDLIDEWADPAPEGEAPYKSVRADLIPVLVKAIQELSARLAALEAK